MMKIAIISVGLGNIASVKNMLERIGGYEVDMLSNPPELLYDWIILPGVGSYDYGINKLHKSGWFDFLKNNREINDKKTGLIGICLGMQLLCEGSEEGKLNGLQLIPGYFRRFSFSNSNLKIPHMGWNTITFSNNIKWNLPVDSRFYFVHSYHYINNNEEYIIGKTNYGFQFGSVIKKDNIIGFQFHPEKSHKFGKLLLSEVIS